MWQQSSVPQINFPTKKNVHKKKSKNIKINLKFIMRTQES